MRPEKTLTSKVIFDSHLKLRIDYYLMPDGSKVVREIIEHSDCVGVIPVDVSDNVYLVSQYREAVGKDLLEIVAGGIEKGEEPETAVRRETQEEVGYLPQKMVKLGGYYLAPGYSTEFLHLYMGTDLVPRRINAEDTAGIRIEKVPAYQLRKLLTSGRITDGKSIAGLYMFLEYRKKSLNPFKAGQEEQ
jgi:ADP-ribose pyrophosphatase